MIAVLSLDLVTRDPAMQMRMAGLDAGVVTDYAEAMTDGTTFPPITVFRDGETHWLADGFHRFEATVRAGLDRIEAEVREGSRRDAILFAAGANANHGMRRTQADKRRAVVTLLTDPEWSKKSDREVARACAVDHKTVAKVKAELVGEIPTGTSNSSTARVVGKSPAAAPTTATSMVERMLATAETAALVAECRRRGLEVSGHAD